MLRDDVRLFIACTPNDAFDFEKCPTFEFYFNIIAFLLKDLELFLPQTGNILFCPNIPTI